MKRTCIYTLLLLFTLLDSQLLSAQASSEVFPRSMLGFLKPGTHVGVRYPNNGPSRDEHFHLLIFDETAWQLAHDAKVLTLEELRKKHAVIESLVATAVAQLQTDLAARTLPKGKRYAEPEVATVVDRSTLICTVIHVGDDYVLVACGDEERNRRVLPKHLIKSIYWDDGLPRLSTNAKIVDAEETELGVAR